MSLGSSQREEPVLIINVANVSVGNGRNVGNVMDLLPQSIDLPSLKQIHVVELVELHGEFHGGLDLGHGAVDRQRCFTSSGEQSDGLKGVRK